MTDIRTIFDGANALGEGPLWDVGEQRFYWIDSMNGLIFRATEDGREYRVDGAA
jgi:L-arabinonolactonase